MPRLLIEYESLNVDKNLIKEARENGKPITLSGVLQRADIPNANKRRYPKKVLEREIASFDNLIKHNQSCGQLDHPADSVVELANVSHIVREIGWSGNDVIGVIELLNTPKGKIAQQLVESGVQIGISSRGVGETKKDNEGYDEVMEDFQLVTFDLVSQPSTSEAWLHLKEGKNLSLSQTPRRYRINKLLDEILMKRN